MNKSIQATGGTPANPLTIRSTNQATAKPAPTSSTRRAPSTATEGPLPLPRVRAYTAPSVYGRNLAEPEVLMGAVRDKSAAFNKLKTKEALT